MKTFHKLLLLLSLFASTALPQSAVLTPANSFIAADIDPGILELPVLNWPIVAWKCRKLVHNTHDMADLTKTFYHISRSFMRNAEGIYKLYDAQGNKINGFTHQMLTIGMRHKEATRFVAGILECIETSRRFHRDVVRILQDTKLPVILVTNKDALTYQKTLHYYGLNSFAIKALVTKEPLSNEVLEFAQRPDTPESYRNLVEEYQNALPTDTIIHATGRKPAAEYYQCLKRIVGKKNIIFFDDSVENLTGFLSALANTDAAQYIALQYQNKAQLAKDFQKLGILKA
jgi:FMN phosphatase YigB (HAD superfamily)